MFIMHRFTADVLSKSQNHDLRPGLPYEFYHLVPPPHTHRLRGRTKLSPIGQVDTALKSKHLHYI